MIAMTTPIRKPELCVRERRLRKSSSVAGKGFVLFSGVSTSFSPLAGGLCVVCSIQLLIAFRILFDAMLCVADSVGQFDFREVVGVKTLNVTFMSAGNRLLRLHHFQIVGDPCGETILRLSECLLRQIDRTTCHGHLLGGSVQVEQGGADLIVDTAAKVSQLRTSLLQLSISLEYVTVSPIAGEDGDVNSGIHLPGTIRLGGIDADVAEIRVKVEGGIMPCRRCPSRKFCCPHFGDRGLVVRTRCVGTLQICV